VFLSPRSATNGNVRISTPRLRLEFGFVSMSEHLLAREAVQEWRDLNTKETYTMRTALRIVIYIALALSIGAAALAQHNGQTNHLRTEHPGLKNETWATHSQVARRI
jgi:succinate dehydrogenase/fumarate reductase flavoprotein subunit